MNKKAIGFSLLCGSVIVAITVIFYIFTFDSIFTVPIRWVSLMCLMVAEVIGIIKSVSVKLSVFGVTNIITSALHVFCVLIVSIVFVNIMPFHIKTYMLLNILLLAFLIIIDVIIVNFGNHIDESNQKLKFSKNTMMNCYTQAQKLCIKYKNNMFCKELNEISEMLRYSDDSILTGSEDQIYNSIKNLENIIASEENENVISAIQDIKNQIECRTLSTKNNQRGNF